jgi:menaquinol-cytochrome c reductase cytochrome b/c subunit
MAEEVEIDQKVYDELIAAGKSERIARAKAKSAAVRAKKAAAGEQVGPREAKAPAAAKAQGGAPAAGGGGAGVATKERAGGGVGGLTPEERQARVAAALAQKGDGATARAGGNGGTKYAGQEHTHRLLAMVPPTGIQQIKGKQDDKVYTWPHLLSSEFICLLAWTAVIALFSAFVAAPLRELANPNITPNPSKAPWYFLGLQELLRYFHPMVAGVTIPTVGIVLAMMLPYVDKNPSIKPENRKTAFVGFTMFLVFAAVVTLVGSFFRGPGFEWIWPWVDNLYFEL